MSVQGTQTAILSTSVLIPLSLTAVPANKISDGLTAETAIQMPLCMGVKLGV